MTEAPNLTLRRLTYLGGVTKGGGGGFVTEVPILTLQGGLVVTKAPILTLRRLTYLGIRAMPSHGGIDHPRDRLVGVLRGAVGEGGEGRLVVAEGAGHQTGQIHLLSAHERRTRGRRRFTIEPPFSATINRRLERDS